MIQLVFATNNKHKLKEARQILPPAIELLSLRDIECFEELPETGNTLEQNARQKAVYIFEKYGMNCFADDTGLEVLALGNRPGVFSARYAGPACRAEDNINLLLHEMKNVTDRQARFRTVIHFLSDGQDHFFEGIIKGSITTEIRGENGFGYDPVFIPEGNSQTFAEMTEQEKNSLSHRGRSLKLLGDWLMKIG